MIHRRPQDPRQRASADEIDLRIRQALEELEAVDARAAKAFALRCHLGLTRSEAATRLACENRHETVSELVRRACAYLQVKLADLRIYL